jgi:protein-tyrosine phosphatase
VRADLDEHEIHLEVIAGGEVAIDRIAVLEEDDLRRFSFGQQGRYVLVEFPYSGWPVGLERLVHSLARGGMGVVVAHPERNRDVAANPGALELVVEHGGLVQLTAASLDGRLGRTTQRTATALLERRLAHLVASDAHSPDLRAVGLSSAVGAIGDRALAEYLTEEVPAAIVAGLDVPPPPPYRGGRGRARRRWPAVRSRSHGNNGAT